MNLFQSFCFKLLILFIASSAIQAEERHIALLCHYLMRGERAFAYRIENACKNIQWKVDILYYPNFEPLKKPDYDFVINMVPEEYERPPCKNYLVLFQPKHFFFESNGFLKEKFRGYDGYLLTYQADHFGPNDFTCNQLPCMRWYPTVHRIEYQIVKPTHLFHITGAWGDRRTKPKFLELLKLLDKKDYTHFYGDPFFKDELLHYAGELPFNADSLYKAMSRDGITLILHSADHNAYGIPSGRIFEAAAASTVIICDKNTFVEEHFGNSVLYIDTKRSAEKIFDQIHAHMKWIKANKEAALALAKQAHTIYMEKFLLEQQLLQLGEFHDSLIRQ